MAMHSGLGLYRFVSRVIICSFAAAVRALNLIKQNNSPLSDHCQAQNAPPLGISLQHTPDVL